MAVPIQPAQKRLVCFLSTAPQPNAVPPGGLPNRSALPRAPESAVERGTADTRDRTVQTTDTTDCTTANTSPRKTLTCCTEIYDIDKPSWASENPRARRPVHSRTVLRRTHRACSPVETQYRSTVGSPLGHTASRGMKTVHMGE
jgi:hypothetical protein